MIVSTTVDGRVLNVGDGEKIDVSEDNTMVDLEGEDKSVGDIVVLIELDELMMTREGIDVEDAKIADTVEVSETE